ncbi:MAG: apolipoprotein N-acyltransferase, partial [Haliea sp.]
LVHTDLPGEEKYMPEARVMALRQLLATTATGGADLSVFPELYLLENAGDIAQGFRRQVVAAVQSSGGALLFGAPTEATAPGAEPSRYNTLVYITPDGKTSLYAKELLLPFSEFLPTSPWLSWAYPYLYRYPQADLAPGDGREAPFVVQGVTLGLSICSELAYAGKASRQAVGAGLLVNASSDSWVPSRTYLAQAHLIARVRAAEAQKPMVRSNNVGYSAFIDERGRVMSETSGASTAGLMSVQPRSGVTPYVALASRVSAWQQASASVERSPSP